MHYCKSLRFEDRPDYAYLKKMFKELMTKQNLDYDYVFDWINMEDSKKAIARFSARSGASVSKGKPLLNWLIIIHKRKWRHASSEYC